MRVLRNLLIGLVILAALGGIVGLLLPERVHVERSVTIAAPPPAVFAYLSDFERFNQWSPWARLDPDTQYQISGTPGTVGARMQWQSADPRVGSGSQEIVAIEPPASLEVALDFGDQGKASAFYRLTPQGSGTQVVWGFDTEFGMDLIGRYFGLMFDSWIGADYEAGLRNLKELVENS